MSFSMAALIIIFFYTAHYCTFIVPVIFIVFFPWTIVNGKLAI